MKEKLQIVFMYCTLGMFLLGIIMIYGTLRANASTNYYILIFGCVLLLPGIIMISIEYFANRTPSSDYATTLKETGDRIAVNLSDCKIVSNNWTHEKPEKSDKEILANEVFGNSYDNNPTAYAAESIIEYSSVVKGRKHTFTSPPIAKDKVTLMLLLELQKETSIYIARENSEYYYFDLEFLMT